MVQKKEEWLRGYVVGVGPFHIDKLDRTFTFSILYVLSPRASDFNHSYKMLSCPERLRIDTLTPKQFKMNWLFCSSYPFDTWIETLLLAVVRKPTFWPSTEGLESGVFCWLADHSCLDPLCVVADCVSTAKFFVFPVWANHCLIADNTVWDNLVNVILTAVFYSGMQTISSFVCLQSLWLLLSNS